MKVFLEKVRTENITSLEPTKAAEASRKGKGLMKYAKRTRESVKQSNNTGMVSKRVTNIHDPKKVEFVKDFHFEKSMFITGDQ